MRLPLHLCRSRFGFLGAILRVCAVVLVVMLLWRVPSRLAVLPVDTLPTRPQGLHQHVARVRSAAQATSVVNFATQQQDGAASASTPGLTWSYLLGDDARESPFGPLSTMECVCGSCRNGHQDSQGGALPNTSVLSSVQCSFVSGAARVCVLFDALLYAEPSPTVTFASTKIPLVVVVCELNPKYQDLFLARKAGVLWRSHNNFGGVKFDHVSEWRLAHIPPDPACTGAGASVCSVPSDLVWQGSRAQTSSWGNGWGIDKHKRTTQLSSVSRAPQLAGSNVA